MELSISFSAVPNHHLFDSYSANFNSSPLVKGEEYFFSWLAFQINISKGTPENAEVYEAGIILSFSHTQTN